MSSDLLAEFDSFYSAPQGKPSSGTSASNDLLFLNDFTEGEQSRASQQWPSARASSIKLSNVALPLGGATEQIKPQQWNINAAQKLNGPLPASHPSSRGNVGSPTHFHGFGSNPASGLSNMGDFPQPQTFSPQDNDIWGGMTSFQPTTKSQISIPQNDIWGTSNNPSSANTNPTLNKQVSEKPGILRRPTLDLFSQNIGVETRSSDSKAAKADHRTYPPPPSYLGTKALHGEVLFDADDMAEGDDDDDDFGEFESVTPEPPFQSRPLPGSNDLSTMFGATSLQDKFKKKPKDLLSTSAALPYPQAPKSPSFQERNPFADLNLATIPVATAIKNDGSRSDSPVTAWPSYEHRVPKASPYVDSPPKVQVDDEWGDFADLPPETPPVPKVDSGLEGSWGWDAVEVVDTEPDTAAEADLPPPTNIPPPSVLLAIFPSIIDLPHSALFKPVANQTFSLKNRIISDPTTIEFLRAYLHLSCVAAHITAGRKLRWKRDTILSQAMSIGPAAAGGKGGMKLAGVDKTEMTKEDREAAEVVRTWKDQLGRLRSAVAVANSSLQDSSKHLAIPDVSEGMHVRTQVGGLTAPKPCLVCGLKREERVNKVDVDVEDSFGEWWVEHWGHRTCRNFWLEHQTKLNQR